MIDPRVLALMARGLTYKEAVRVLDLQAFQTAKKKKKKEETDGMTVYTLPERERYCPSCHSLYHFMKGVEISFTCSKCGGILVQKVVQKTEV